MRSVSVFLSALFALILVGLPASAQPLKVSHSPRELSLAVLRELSIQDGKLRFRADSNGCTDAGSFKVRVGREEGLSPQAPHYPLTIERDLEKDLRLTGAYTLSVRNPVFPKEGLVP